ncbi:MAG: MarR family transcriptional regulator [Gemmatimonadetes bacterium]|nr:MarR family transcriptional regulator [Gemmatimonadota bacterium]
MNIPVRITPFDPSLAPHFARLNREWIERYFVLEPADLAVLDDPESAIIDPGGMIYFALVGDEVVGTCAVLPHADGTLELAKMAVSPAAQGRGVGRLLGEACVAFARQTGAHTLMLLSNSRLAPALHLYETLGFRHAPVPDGVEYARADVHMVMPLARE